ncbi:unnamed protein product, partial [Amoebophrya sp. A25]
HGAPSRADLEIFEPATDFQVPGEVALTTEKVNNLWSTPLLTGADMAPGGDVRANGMDGDYLATMGVNGGQGAYVQLDLRALPLKLRAHARCTLTDGSNYTQNTLGLCQTMILSMVSADGVNTFPPLFNYGKAGTAAEGKCERITTLTGCSSAVVRDPDFDLYEGTPDGE